MMRRLVRSAIRGATATAGSGVSLRIDPLILRAANILPFEEVEVVSHATLARLTTFAEPAGEGSGEIVVPGVRAGDAISILSWGVLHDGQTVAHRVVIVTVDDQNRVVAITEG